MAVMATRPLLRWLLPAGIAVAVIGGGAATSAVRASADASLPDRSAQQLLVDLTTARLDGLSGTVVERADLGLPELPGNIGGQGSSSLNSLITGSHTLRVWYSGPDKARIALLGTLGESDVIKSGSDLWTWSSDSNTASHRKLSDEAGTGAAPKHAGNPMVDPTRMPATPQQAADQALAAIGPTTSVATNGRASVAGRAAYDLIITPKDAGSKVASVHIAIDGTRHVPLRVQVFARGYAKPAAEVAFTQVSFARPDAARFNFNPPPGVKVTEDGADATARPAQSATPDGAPEPVMVGTGWTSVLAANISSTGLLGGTTDRPGVRVNPDGAQAGTDRRGAAGNQIGALLAGLPQVSGSWGSGRLLTGRLFSVLLTDDGRVFVGAVNPDRLYAAATDPATAGLTTK